MACFQAPFTGLVYPTSNDARYSKTVVVHYPLHPFFGRGELPVCRRRGIGNIQHVEVEIDNEQQAVPLWMTDELLCQHFVISLEPNCSLSALLELFSLLQATDL